MLLDLIFLGIALLPQLALLFWTVAPVRNDFVGEP